MCDVELFGDANGDLISNDAISPLPQPTLLNGGSDILNLPNFIIGNYVYLDTYCFNQTHYGPRLAGKVMVTDTRKDQLILSRAEY